MILWGIYFILWIIAVVSSWRSAGNSGHMSGLAGGFATLALFLFGGVFGLILLASVIVCAVAGISQLWAVLFAVPTFYLVVKVLSRKKN